MKQGHRTANGKVVSGIILTADESAEQFKSDGWERKYFYDKQFLSQFGINAPPEAFLFAGSRSIEPSTGNLVAGLDVFRYDKKDESKNLPINRDHYDFIICGNEVIIYSKADKSDKHQYSTVEEGKRHLTEAPPHLRKNTKNDKTE